MKDIDYAKSLYDKIIVNTQCVLKNIEFEQQDLPNKLVCTNKTIFDLVDLAKENSKKPNLVNGNVMVFTYQVIGCLFTNHRYEWAVL